MLKHMTIASAVAVFAATCALTELAFAQKQITFKPLDKAAAREIEVRQLLLLVDAKKDGTISKQDWIESMAAEFDRLDKNNSGVLDVSGAPQSQWAVRQRAIPGSALLGK